MTQRWEKVISLVFFHPAAQSWKAAALEAYNFGHGRVVWENSVPKFQYRLADHLGNTVVFFEDKNNNGCITTEEEATSPADLEIIQRLLYYPFGMALEGLGAWNAQPWQQYRYNGKERDTLTGWYDYSARWYLSDIGRFPMVDPLASLQPDKNPFHYCSNNPISRIDPSGMRDGIFLDESGKEVGNDGKEDGKVYIIKTTSKEFDSEVSSAGISKSDAKTTIDFVKKNSGNTKAFEANPIAYNNSVEIIGSKNIRQNMIDIVDKDNGRGGSLDANNREYGGIIRNGQVIESPTGRVGNPKTDLEIAIVHPDIRGAETTFHSHPSGYITIGPPRDVIGGQEITYSWTQAPSKHDIRYANGIEYVFAQRTGIVYVYNNTGVIATIPKSRFVTPK